MNEGMRRSMMHAALSTIAGREFGRLESAPRRQDSALITAAMDAVPASTPDQYAAVEEWLRSIPGLINEEGEFDPGELAMYAQEQIDRPQMMEIAQQLRDVMMRLNAIDGRVAWGFTPTVDSDRAEPFWLTQQALLRLLYYITGRSYQQAQGVFNLLVNNGESVQYCLDYYYRNGSI